ncbi:Tar ligand binding domain-containing protein [Kiloniella sp. EL199]|uniref:Tar ligand binding domain-containing protein n=1 Tax=Kiloniella sp. EL199 TaxID=2107581 RepID=UPI000EA22A98|nr:Tar ligand binding domain-containing protein [Kiloniella sp. EL199]
MQNIKNKMTSVSAKILGVIALCMLSLMSVSGFSIYQMQQIGEELEGIAEQNIPLTNILTKITTHQLEQAISYERAAKYGEHRTDDAHFGELYDKAKKSFQDLTILVDEEILKGEEIAADAISRAHNEAEFKEFTHVLEVLKKVEKEHHDYDKHANEIFNLLEAGKLKEAFAAEEKFEAEAEQLIHELEEILFEVEEFTANAALAAEHHEIFALRVLIILTIVVLILAPPYLLYHYQKIDYDPTCKNRCLIGSPVIRRYYDVC